MTRFRKLDNVLIFILGAVAIACAAYLGWTLTDTYIKPYLF